MAEPTARSAMLKTEINRRITARIPDSTFLSYAQVNTKQEVLLLFDSRAVLISQIIE